MRLYHGTQVSQKVSLRNKKERHHSWMVQHHQVMESQQQQQQQQENDDRLDLIKPRKLPNPVLASHQHRNLHRELLFCHRRGLLPRRKPELQRVLEHKQREQHKQRELSLRPISDLEAKLRSRRQRIQVCEMEEKKRNERLRNVPEFIQVRGTLKHVRRSSSCQHGHNGLKIYCP